MKVVELGKSIEVKGAVGRFQRLFIDPILDLTAEHLVAASEASAIVELGEAFEIEGVEGTFEFRPYRRNGGFNMPGDLDLVPAGFKLEKPKGDCWGNKEANAKAER